MPQQPRREIHAALPGSDEAVGPTIRSWCCSRPAGGRFGKSNYDRMKASRSALITSAFVVHMPCGKPGYTLSVPFLSSLA